MVNLTKKNIMQNTIKNASTEQKVNDINPLVDGIDTYTKTNLELVKLKVIDQVSEITSKSITTVLFGVVIGLFTLNVNIALGIYLGEVAKNPWMGFLVIAGFYAFLAIMLFLTNNLIRTSINNTIIKKSMK